MKVILSVLNMGWVHKQVAAYVMGISRDERVELDVYFPTERPCEANRNGMAQIVRESDAEWWISIDDDNPPTKNVIDLCFIGVDLVACPTQIWKPGNPGKPYIWNALDGGDGYYREHTTTTGLQPVDAFGTGCFVCHRKVLEAIQHPFQTLYNRWGVITQGLDLTFCERAKAAGFQPHVHYAYPCHHISKEVDLLELTGAIEYADVHQRLVSGPGAGEL